MKNKSGFSALRKGGCVSGACVFALVGLFGAGLTPAAQAREAAGFFGFQNRGETLQSQDELRRQQRPANRQRPAPKQSIKNGNKQADKKEAPPPPGPHLLVVSIKSQRITLYSNGKNVATSPISSGTESNPTPHGVFSIIQRNRHHKSNIYSGAPMPYMQRLTWSGIALHQGVLPGRPASHGCIRLPESFANFLWRTTKMNTRVIIARDDVEPQDIVHAKLFQPKQVPTTVESPLQDLRKTLDTTHHFIRTAGLKMVVNDSVDNQDGDLGDSPAAAEDNETKNDADDASSMQSAPSGDDRADSDNQATAPQESIEPAVKQDISVPQPPAPDAPVPLQVVQPEAVQPDVALQEAVQLQAKQPDVALQEPVKQDASAAQPAPIAQEVAAPQPEAVRQEVAAPQPPESAKQEPAKQEIAAPQSAPVQAEPAKREIAVREPAKADPKADITATVLPQRVEIPDTILASFEKSLVAKEKMARPSGPISIFISRKDKRLYVRQAFIPLFTADVSFTDENSPFGTHIFTAYDQDDGKALRWTALTLPAEAPVVERPKPAYRIDAYGRRIEVPAKPVKKPAETHVAVPSAASVLDRIDIPKDVAERISEYMKPGSSLIISDQGLGHETGLYTDFIVVTKK